MLYYKTTTITTDDERADAFAEYLQKVFTPRRNPYQHPVDRLNPDSHMPWHILTLLQYKLSQKTSIDP